MGRLTSMGRPLGCLLGMCVFMSACATGGSVEGTKVADTASTGQKVEAFDGNQRLADTVTPQHYGLSLAIDPAKKTFSGTARITVELAEKTSRIDLHGTHLDVDRAWATVGQTDHDARVAAGEHGGITMALSEPIGPGAATLGFSYRAPLDETTHGLYRVKDGGVWYAFTQFEPVHAREVFPSFDEPRFKTPFDVTIEVADDNQKAFANAPVEDVVDTGGAPDDATKYVFKQTRPLPTYLVAFAVGPLEVLEAPDDAIDGVALRAITTRGKTHLARYALRRAPQIIAAQSAYFGIDFPFAKLDVVAAPNFAAGAMENVGLVTFREQLLLVDPDTVAASDAYALQSVMAHEFAHMWFGDYVTMHWWNDIWLNEAFATWTATRTVNQVAPKFSAGVDALEASLRVMSSDTLAAARAIRQPIRTGGDITNAFDSITYTKGRAVLRMLEEWMGQEAFRQGVRQYLADHAYGNASTDDLLAAWTEASDKPVEQTARLFLDQPGVPLVGADYRCSNGSTTVNLTQTRYLPAGSQAESGKPWQIPVCIKYEADGHAKQFCDVLDGPTESVTLPTQSCPAWIHPNADEAGYYHWKLPGHQMVDLATQYRDKLELAEKIAVLPHARALVEAHAISFETYLKLVEAMSREDNRVIVEQVIDAMYRIREYAVDGTNESQFQSWAKRVIGPHARRLGFTPRQADTADDRLLRRRVIRAAADLADNDKLRARAAKMVQNYLDNPDVAAPAQLPAAMRIAAWNGDRQLWAALRDGIDRAPTPAIRVATIKALGSFRDPELVGQSLDLLINDPQVRSQDAWSLMGTTLGLPRTRQVAWAWLQKHWQSVVDHVGERTAASLPWIGSGFCSAERKREVADFFGQHTKQVSGMRRKLDQVLETIDQCVRYRAYVIDDARAFLDAQVTANR